MDLAKHKTVPIFIWIQNSTLCNQKGDHTLYEGTRVALDRKQIRECFFKYCFVIEPLGLGIHIEIEVIVSDHYNE